MYITLFWSTAAAPAPVETAINNCVNARGFTNVCTVQQGLIVANITHDFTRQQVQLLHNDLKLQVPIVGAFSWLITVSPNFWDYIASPDVETAKRTALATVVNYAT